jgi:acetyl-CoA carboxylase carboxyl transferase subunit beta
MAWFRRQSEPEPQPEPKKVRTEGLWIKCDSCRAIIGKKDLEANELVCTKCGFHFKIDARSRLELLFDDAKWEEFDTDLKSNDALHFVDQKPYRERLEKAAASTGLKDAVISAAGRMGGHSTVICAMEYRFADTHATITSVRTSSRSGAPKTTHSRTAG